ncbi:MAG: VWA domain-containing protein [Silvibacterium sp.]
MAAPFCFAQNPFPGEPPAASQPQQSQNPFPGEPPATQQQQQQQQQAVSHDVTASQIEPPTIRVNTSVVLVPTLVEDHSGQVIYALKPSDFLVYDNGIQQKVHVDEEMDTDPVSLVVCIQRSRDATMEFDKFAHLGPLLQLFTGGNDGEAALVIFDSKPVYLEGFQQDTSYIERDLQQLPEGDGGAAILDAVGFSLNLLEQRPLDHRRVLLLISETRDHGSHSMTIPQLVERIGVSNTLVFSVSFSPSKAEFMDWGKGHGGGAGDLNLLGPVLMAVNAMRRNVPRTLAEMSGGEYEPFARERAFEDRIEEAARHAHNRYILSFYPNDPTPGLHTLQVKLTQDYDARIVARANYWAVNDAAAKPVSPASK